MKKQLIFLSMLCFLGFSEILSSTSDRQLFFRMSDDFDWLIGSWKRTNEAEGLQTYEHWKKVSDREFRALGYTLKASDTVWQESIKLIKTEEQWNYIVQLQDAKPPTVFKVTKIEMTGFTCENSDNEFPKKVRYAKVQNGMNAVISGDGKVILFQFARNP